MAFADNETLKKISSALTKEFHPQKMYLFGSYANGTAVPEKSDYDVVVVVSKTKDSFLERLQKAQTLSRTLSIKSDIWVYTEEEFRQQMTVEGSIAYTALTNGQELTIE